MSRSVTFVIVVFFVGLTGLSFELGRRVATRRMRAVENLLDSQGADRQHELTEAAGPGPESLDIRKIGTRSFVEVYPVIRAASAQQRAEWAKELEEMPEGPQRWAATNIFYKTLVQIDPEEAAHLAMKIQSEIIRLGVAGAMAVVVPYRSMGEVVKLLQTFPRNDLQNQYGSSNAFNDALEAWSAVDPLAVARFIDSHPGENVLLHRATLVRYWAAYDPAAAKAWLDRSVPRDSQESGDSPPVIRALLSGWFENDSSGAIDFAVANQQDAKLSGGIDAIAKKLIADSPDAARAFVDRLSGEAKLGALLSASLKDGVPERGVPGQASRHETEDVEASPPPPPQVVADWLVKFPPDDDSDTAITMFLSQWNHHETGSLLNWVTQLPIEIRSRVVSHYPAPDVVDCETQIPPILALPDAQLRDQILETIVPNTLSGRDEFVALLEKSALAPAEKEHFISLMPKDEPADASDEQESADLSSDNP